MVSLFSIFSKSVMIFNFFLHYFIVSILCFFFFIIIYLISGLGMGGMFKLPY